MVKTHPWRKNKRTFDDNQRLQCAPNVPSGDEILRQLKGMPFGDENAGKSKPESSKKKGEKWKKSTPNNRQLESNHDIWKKNSIFFKLPY
jgi:hypothetical protein